MKNQIIVVIIMLIISSCSNTNPRQFTYFKDVPDTATYFEIPDTAFIEPAIKPDDVLLINISSPNAEATSFFTTPGTPSAAAANTGTPSSTPNTYLVDKEGNIYLPLVGAITVKGMNTNAARQVITSKIAVYLKDPIVTVRYYNFKVTVLGEVARPASYMVPNERVSILDALGMAGDLTIYGRRENVLLVREKTGKKVLTRLNLNSSALFKSPYYYLQQNDIVYVEPNKAKAANSDRSTIRTITIITSLVSLVTIIISRLL